MVPHTYSVRELKETTKLQSSLLDSVSFRERLYLRVVSMNNVAAECRMCLPIFTSADSHVSTGLPDTSHQLPMDIPHTLFYALSSSLPYVSSCPHSISWKHLPCGHRGFFFCVYLCAFRYHQIHQSRSLPPGNQIHRQQQTHLCWRERRAQILHFSCPDMNISLQIIETWSL